MSRSFSHFSLLVVFDTIPSELSALTGALCTCIDLVAAKRLHSIVSMNTSAAVSMLTGSSHKTCNEWNVTRHVTRHSV